MRKNKNNGLYKLCNNIQSIVLIKSCRLGEYFRYLLRKTGKYNRQGRKGKPNINLCSTMSLYFRKT